jgi:lipopolysaccharide export system permease protein
LTKTCGFLYLSQFVFHRTNLSVLNENDHHQIQVKSDGTETRIDMMPQLQRYVMGELLRVFALALGGLVVILVFVGVLGEALKSGLGPEQILQILPYVVPNLLPFTIPATLLLTVCVVYGRMAGDQEITATKAAGISVMSLIWPALFFGGVLSVGTLILTDQFIPWSRDRIQETVWLATEDIFLDTLRTKGHVIDARTNVSISCMAVQGRTLIKPTFRYRPKGGKVTTIEAERAGIDFDLKRKEIVLQLHEVHLERGTTTGRMKQRIQRFPMPDRDSKRKSPRDLTIRQLEDELVWLELERERLDQRRMLATAIALTRGNFETLYSPEFQHFQYQIHQHTDRYNKIRTEIHSRFALSCSCFFFALLGTPFSIWQARRQFLMTFACCFFPVLICYYPIILGCITFCKSHGDIHPASVMWLGNALLASVGIWVLQRVLRN